MSTVDLSVEEAEFLYVALGDMREVESESQEDFDLMVIRIREKIKKICDPSFVDCYE